MGSGCYASAKEVDAGIAAGKKCCGYVRTPTAVKSDEWMRSHMPTPLMMSRKMRVYLVMRCESMAILLIILSAKCSVHR